ncbi:MAG: hypothetical protein JWN01_246 [Patescibacteria group bacterium]|nr:hypothetical protein [Patescibacteria group bacterium]
MTVDHTHEELRADIRADIIEITTAIVTENNYRLMRMINEDLVAISDRGELRDKQLRKRFKELAEKFGDLEQAAQTHALNPIAHTKP